MSGPGTYPWWKTSLTAALLVAAVTVALVLLAGSRFQIDWSWQSVAGTALVVGLLTFAVMLLFAPEYWMRRLIATIVAAWLTTSTLISFKFTAWLREHFGVHVDADGPGAAFHVTVAIIVTTLSILEYLRSQRQASPMQPATQPDGQVHAAASVVRGEHESEPARTGESAPSAAPTPRGSTVATGAQSVAVGGNVGVINIGPPAPAAASGTSERHDLGAPQFIESTRLTRTCDVVIEKLGGASRVVALRGRPGDGKTQVARQAASRIPGSLYLELGTTQSAEAAWNDALARITQELSRTPYTIQSLEASVRDAGAELSQSKIRLVVFDNADAPLPPGLDVRKLTRHDGSLGVLLVGPGARGVDDEVSLPPPDEGEFAEIVAMHLGPGAPTSIPAITNLVRRIGEASGFSALVARCTADDCSIAQLETDLKTFLAVLETGSLANTDESIDRALGKCWSSLNAGERKRVAFVAALDGEVPEEWVPATLTGHGPRVWRMLDRSGLVTRKGEVTVVRLHRLARLWVARRLDVDVSAEIHALLVSWMSSPEIADELRSRMGLAPAALLFGVQHLIQRKALDPQAPRSIDDELLLKTYLETCQTGYAGQAYEQQLQVLFGQEGERVATSPPSVLGQLIDNARLEKREQDGDSTSFRGHVVGVAQSVLREFEARLPAGISDDSQWSVVSGVHHLAKEMVRGDADAKVRGVELLRSIVAKCEAFVAASRRPDLWQLQIIKSTLQICGPQTLTEDEERISRLKALAPRLGPARAPRYLQLRVVELLLRVQSISSTLLGPEERRDLVRRGVQLCHENSVPRVQADFLRSAAGEIERLGDTGTISLLRSSAYSLLSRVESSPRALKDAGTALAHVLHKAGASARSAEGTQDLHSALRLYLQQCRGRKPNSFIQGRVAAVLRDAGRLEESATISESLHGSEKNFFTSFEYAKVLRFQGRIKDGEAVLDACLVVVNEGGSSVLPTPVGRECSVRDERAKLLAKFGDRQRAASLLQENVTAYSAQGHEHFAQRCAKWASDLLEGRGTESEDGLLQDEWLLRCRQSTSRSEDALGIASLASEMMTILQAQGTRS